MFGIWEESDCQGTSPDRSGHGSGTSPALRLGDEHHRVIQRSLTRRQGARVAITVGSRGISGLQEAVPAAQILAREPWLLKDARRRMPKLPTDDLDVLIVHQIGKDVSGAGMDPTITGRYHVGYLQGDIRVDRLVVLNLTKSTAGYAVGIGMAGTDADGRLLVAGGV